MLLRLHFKQSVHIICCITQHLRAKFIFYSYVTQNFHRKCKCDMTGCFVGCFFFCLFFFYCGLHIIQNNICKSGKQSHLFSLSVSLIFILFLSLAPDAVETDVLFTLWRKGRAYFALLDDDVSTCVKSLLSVLIAG